MCEIENQTPTVCVNTRRWETYAHHFKVIWMPGIGVEAIPIDTGAAFTWHASGKANRCSF